MHYDKLNLLSKWISKFYTQFHIKVGILRQANHNNETKKTQRKYTIAKQSIAHKCHICNCTNRWCSLKFYHPRSKDLLTENDVKLSLMLYTMLFTMLLFHVQIISTN